MHFNDTHAPSRSQRHIHTLSSIHPFIHKSVFLCFYFHIYISSIKFSPSIALWMGVWCAAVVLKICAGNYYTSRLDTMDRVESESMLAAENKREYEPLDHGGKALCVPNSLVGSRGWHFGLWILDSGCEFLSGWGVTLLCCALCTWPLCPY